jgi:hypothetical protein
MAVDHEVDLANPVDPDWGQALQASDRFPDIRPPLLIAILERQKLARIVGAALHTPDDGCEGDLLVAEVLTWLCLQQVAHLPVAEQCG